MNCPKVSNFWAQLVERFQWVRGLNPDIGKIYIEHLFTVNAMYWKDKNKEK